MRVPFASLSVARNVALAGVLVIVVVCLAIAIIRQDDSDHYLDSDPARALSWQPSSAEAWAALGRKGLVQGRTAAAAASARRSLSLEPFDTVALSTLGMALDRAGHSSEADKIMTVAGSLGWRDAFTQVWLFARRLSQHRYREAFERADALLRREEPRLQPLLFGTLISASANSHAVAALADRLETSPSWRTEFLALLCANSDPRVFAAAHEILIRLAHGPTPPLPNEVAPFVRRLVSGRNYVGAERAMNTFVKSPTPRGEFVHGGDLTDAADVSPFSWSLADGIGWTASVTQNPTEARANALRIEYDGFSTPQPLRQMLVVPPGEYTLTGEALLASDAGEGRFAWKITCVDTDKSITNVRITGRSAGKWQQFQAPFEVPSNDCPAQWLSLSAEPGDEHTDIVAWFTALSVTARREAH